MSKEKYLVRVGRTINVNEFYELEAEDEYDALGRYHTGTFITDSYAETSVSSEYDVEVVEHTREGKVTVDLLDGKPEIEVDLEGEEDTIGDNERTIIIQDKETGEEFVKIYTSLSSKLVEGILKGMKEREIPIEKLTPIIFNYEAVKLNLYITPPEIETIEI